MCVAHCDAVGYIALRGVIMNNEELALRIQQGEDVKRICSSYTIRITICCERQRRNTVILIR